MLFRAALDALDKGDWGTACTKFDASMGLDPAVSTLINVAKCHAHEGKLAIAWAELNRALVLNGETAGAQRRADLEKYAKGLIAALEPRLPKLTIVAREKPPGLRITRDGVEMSAAALGEALPVDPGAHEIEASAPGYGSEKRKVHLSEGKAETVELTLMATTPAPLVVVPAARAVTLVEAPKTRGWRTAGFVIGGIGVLGLGEGIVAGVLAIGDKKSAHCNAAGVCASEPLASARRAALASDVGLIAGGVLFAGGVTLVVLNRVNVTPTVGANRSGIAVGGKF